MPSQPFVNSPIFHMIIGAPDPVAPFSHAVESDGWVFITGLMPFVDTPLSYVGGSFTPLSEPPAP